MGKIEPFKAKFSRNFIASIVNKSTWDGTATDRASWAFAPSRALNFL